MGNSVKTDKEIQLDLGLVSCRTAAAVLGAQARRRLTAPA